MGRIGIVAVVASLDIALSQWSFEYIDVALYTITKSTSIVFILMFSLFFKLEKKHWSLIIIVLMISVGLAMFTYKSTEFVLAGFIMVLTASFLSGKNCQQLHKVSYCGHHLIIFRHQMDTVSTYNAKIKTWSLQSS